jgi:peptide/nickel transport system permease protein
MTKKRASKAVKLKNALVILLFALMFVAVMPFFFDRVTDVHMAEQLQPPSFEHLFGTDNFGRDQFERVITGMRHSLMISLTIQVISVGFGTLIGLVSGYLRGFLDGIVLYFNNITMSIPLIIAVLCAVSVMGASEFTLILSISLVESVYYGRLVRGQVVSLKERDFVLGARASGARLSYILFRHVLPGVFMPVLPLASLMIGETVVAVSVLSFLGVGVQPPTPEIGSMLNEALSHMGNAPWLMIFPGTILCLYSFWFNITGDLLADYFDPTYMIGGEK